MFTITDEDITYVERLLLQPGESFDEKRVEIIKNLSSVDIIASPGSGKTTTLIAKLAILETKLPFQENKGICVLTHTNVGIDEIKERLHNNGKGIFNYPNNCSTIQSFVNQFLAIPAYIHFYGKRPVTIDNNMYEERIIRKYFNDIPRGIRYGIEKKNIDIKKMRFNLEDGRLTKDLYGNDLYKDKMSESYQALKNLKESLMEEGVLCYDDAYYLANKYLKSFPEISDVFSRRFGYVFIDEMQDTLKHQSDIFQSLFDDSVVIQKIGDPNQAIFDQSISIGGWDVNIEESINIQNSKRFSVSIANITNKICVEPQGLIGSSIIENIPPYILVFNDKDMEKVLPAFSDLIIEHEVHTKGDIFKAIGWVSDPEKPLSLMNYWPSYKKKNSIKYLYLRDYLIKESVTNVIKYGSNLYRKKIIKAILYSLRKMNEKNGDKYYTEVSFMTFLKDNYSEVEQRLLTKITKWCIDIEENKAIFQEVKEFIINDLKEIFGWKSLFNLNDFLDSSKCSFHSQTEGGQSFYIKSAADRTIEIEVSTIHSIKGETHTATLYLETFYYDYDIKRIIEYLKGNHKNTQAQRKNQNLKMTYVGITRPSHFLCIALKKESIEGHEKELSEAGWTIKHV